MRKNEVLSLEEIERLCDNFIDLGVEKIAGGFDKPIYVLPVPNSFNEILVLEQKGIVRIVKDGKVTKTPFLNITDRVHKPLFPGDEMGFLGFTFDPSYSDNKYFYVHYNDKDDNNDMKTNNSNDFNNNKNGNDKIVKNRS